MRHFKKILSWPFLLFRKKTFLENITQEEISALIKIFPQGIVSIDLETTGLSPFTDRIIEIGMIKLLPSGEIKSFRQLVNPEISISKKSTEIHGIDNSMVKDASTLGEIMPSIVDFIHHLPLVAHNAFFDIGHLMLFWKQNQYSTFNNRVYDSCKIARKFVKNSPNFKLQTLAEFFAVKLKTEHRALEDAFTCMRVLANTIEQSSLQRLECEFTLHDYQQIKHNSIPVHLQDLVDKNPHKTILLIEYKGKSISETKRPIQYVSILPLPRGLYLYALCLISGQYKFFTLNKVKSIEYLSLDQQRDLATRYKVKDFL